MPIEVEQKYRIASPDDLRQRLLALGAQAEDPIAQVDIYYAHPQRDFAATDEALRIRRVGQANCLTYKGPKQGATTKTRQELELAIADGDQGAACGFAILEALGFHRVAEVQKQRQCYHLTRGEWTVEVALDEVVGLGLLSERGIADEAGSFIELEIVVDQPQVDSAERAILGLADELGLSQVERSSYLELLLNSRGH